MKRILAFLALLLVFFALTFPQERFLLSLVEEPLREAEVDLQIGGASFALPLGWEATGLAFNAQDFGLQLDSFYVGLLKNIDVRGCGGWLTGDLDGRDDLTVAFEDLDPSRCLRIGDVQLQGGFAGEAHFEGIGHTGVISLGHTGFARVQSDGGTFSGRLPAEDSAAGIEIGEWEFGKIDVDLELANGRLEFRRGQALASGVAFEVLRGHLAEGLRKDPVLEVEFRVRAVEKAARAKAILGMLPKAEADYDGWRRYRLSGEVSKLKLIGLRE